jgi:hypothetical protein
MIPNPLSRDPTAHLASGVIAATRSISWNASRPAKERFT